MKKGFMFLLLVVTVFTAGCTSSSDSGDDSGPKEVVIEEPTDSSPQARVEISDDGNYMWFHYKNLPNDATLFVSSENIVDVALQYIVNNDVNITNSAEEQSIECWRGNVESGSAHIVCGSDSFSLDYNSTYVISTLEADSFKVTHIGKFDY